MRLIDADAINPMRCPRSISEMRKWIDEQPTVDIDKVLKQFYTIIEELADKLEYYEILEEQGRLLELPCAVGDTVYLFSHDIIRPFIINGFEINKYEVEFKGSYCGEEKNLEHWAIRLPVSKICKTVFLTKEEAEAKLKEAGEQNDYRLYGSGRVF